MVFLYLFTFFILFNLQLLTHSWCTHCQKLSPLINSLPSSPSLPPSVTIATVNCDIYTSICRKYNVYSYPTIYYIKNSEEYLYKGYRTIDGFIKFINRVSEPIKRIGRDVYEEKKDREGVFFVVGKKKENKIGDGIGEIRESGIGADEVMILEKVARNVDVGFYYVDGFEFSVVRSGRVIPFKPTDKGSLQFIYFLGDLKSYEDVKKFVEKNKYPAVIELDLSNVKDMIENWCLVYIYETNDKKNEMLELFDETLKLNIDENVLVCLLDAGKYKALAHTLGYTSSESDGKFVIVNGDYYYDTSLHGKEFAISESSNTNYDEIITGITDAINGKLQRKSRKGWLGYFRDLLFHPVVLLVLVCCVVMIVYLGFGESGKGYAHVGKAD